MLDLFLAQFFIISSFRADDDCLTIFLEISFIIIIVKTLENYFHNLLPAITRFELAFDKPHLDFGAELLKLNSVESFDKSFTSETSMFDQSLGGLVSSPAVHGQVLGLQCDLLISAVLA